jgi:leucyl-tRNA synthetase
MVERYGADSTRLYALFAAPPDRDLDWQEQGVEGCYRFLGRVFRFVTKYAAMQGSASADEISPEARAIQRKMHQTIAKITQDFDGRWHFNTCIAAIMEFVNELYAAEEAIAAGKISPALVRDAMKNLVLLIAPFAPYLSAELWTQLGERDLLLKRPWPHFDPELVKADVVELAVQVNGKLRARITVPADAAEDAVRETALADEKVKAAIEGKQIVKVIVVPGKLVNIVVR